MPPRPKASLDDLTVPKGVEPDAGVLGDKPSSTSKLATPVGATSLKNYAHTLSLRLTAEQYRRLRRYVAKVEDEGHGRVTHQGVIETALSEYLDRQQRS